MGQCAEEDTWGQGKETARCRPSQRAFLDSPCWRYKVTQHEMYRERNLLSQIRRIGPYGKPRRRWEDNLKIYLKQGVWQGVYLINLNRNRGSGSMVWTQERTFGSHNMSKFWFHKKEYAVLS